MITEVADGNARATRVCAAAGFAPTGRFRPMLRNSSVREVELRLLLS